MSLAVLKSRALAGMLAAEVTVEVHLANGLPQFTIVGLPDTEVKEARDRVRAALQTTGFEFPARRITVNLAPADLPKESGRFDLAIALGILAAAGEISTDELERYEFAGELSLSGALRPVRGALAMALAVARTDTRRAFVLPRANAQEAALAGGAHILPADTLLQVCAHFAAGSAAVRLERQQVAAPAADAIAPDLADVKGQLAARRALEVAAAGAHGILLCGPPGTGKSMLAQRLPGILPPMGDEEALEAAALHSLAGRFDAARWRRRPFRSPHHSASAAALVGGGNPPRPGEISLAHRGVLFLDELPEFSRHVLEVLREPLESGVIHLSRAARQAEYPAAFQLVAAMNPCPCGYLGHATQACRCTPDIVLRYRQRLSGPLLDRIDMQVTVGSIAPAELRGAPPGEASSAVAARVDAAHARQLQRQGLPNARLDSRSTETLCRLDADSEALLQQAMARFAWSARATVRVLRLARTVADLEGAEDIAVRHLGEAIQYRRGME